MSRLLNVTTGAGVCSGFTINLGNFLLSLSDAMDLASPKLTRHQQRVALISLRLGQAAGLSEERLANLFSAALLHDIGALSPEDKINVHDCEVVNPELHCIRGAALFASVPLLASGSDIIKYHHLPWHWWQEPIEKPNVLEAQLVSLADHLERSIDRETCILQQCREIGERIRSLSGTAFHPHAVELFQENSGTEAFWLDIVSPRLYSLLLHSGPYQTFEVDLDTVSAIGRLFRNMIDFRSRFTSTHSSVVADSAMLLARLSGLGEREIELMGVAGNLHDIGKLIIPNAILEKPGKLTPDEFAVIRQHTYFTYSVLNNIHGFEELAEWAAFHHERLDGNGYPFHHSADRLSTGARIMAVADCSTAISEDRPYRKGMSKSEIIATLQGLSDSNGLDKEIVNIYTRNYDEYFSQCKLKQAEVRHYYDEQFLSLDTKGSMWENQRIS